MNPITRFIIALEFDVLVANMLLQYQNEEPQEPQSNYPVYQGKDIEGNHLFGIDGEAKSPMKEIYLEYGDPEATKVVIKIYTLENNVTNDIIAGEDVGIPLNAAYPGGIPPEIYNNPYFFIKYWDDTISEPFNLLSNP